MLVVSYLHHEHLVDCNLAHTIASLSFTLSLAQDTKSFASCKASSFVEWVVYCK